MTYQFDCDCGQAISAEVWQCGIEVMCSACGCHARVPDLVILKELSGDKYPLLSPLQKIGRTLQNRESPFDGQCHGCRSAAAEFMIPITFAVMKERAVDDSIKIRPRLTHIYVIFDSRTEYWHYVTFPILVCAKCFPDCRSSLRKARTRKIGGSICTLGIFVGFLGLACHDPESIAGLVCVFTFIGGIAWILSQRRKCRIDPRVMTWLEKIRWVPEAIAAEEEYQLSIGKACEFQDDAGIGGSRNGHKSRGFKFRLNSP